MSIATKQFKKCPRCGEKALLAVSRCNECGLVFSRMARASNLEAQTCIKNKEYDKVLYTSVLPLDVTKLKLLLLCLFGGMIGLHSFYVGRKKRGTYSAVVFSIMIIIIVFQLDLIWGGYDVFMSFFGIFGGIMGIMWLYDLLLISINKFKVPVALKPEKGRV